MNWKNKPWTFTRVLFLLLGTWVCIDAIYSRQWIAFFAGLYFAVTGLLGLACAGGNCVPDEKIISKGNEIDISNLEPIKYEEIK